MTADKLDFKNHEICILIQGEDGNESDTKDIEAHIQANYPSTEIYVVLGQQKNYNYMIVAE